jgi:pimeloyl-ACP methyl ester carboxylesterase
MNWRLCIAGTAAAVALMTGCANVHERGPITIAEQGSFFVGGREVQGAGVYDPTKSTANTNEGNTFWVDQMYVQYQIPVSARKYPLVFVHGGGGTGRVWETTPDGREGFQSIFVRRGFPVYIVDFPRRGRAGLPSFNGPFGALDGQQVVPNLTNRAGIEYAWVRWRLGPKYPDVFPVQQFPMNALDSFVQHLVPTISDDAEIISAALAALVDKIGPSILVTHSQSGLFGWMAAAKSSNVKGIVSYEPGYVFPRDALPQPIALFKGTMPAGTGLNTTEYESLARIPIQVVYGDNIPQTPIPDLVADGRRAQVVASKLFAAAIAKQGGNAEILHLPEVGLRGNSHFMFSDLNNAEVADQLSKFLRERKLD